jgi:hypothetical protein
MGPGSLVGFPVSAKNKNLLYDHPMNISVKFGSNLFCGFRKKDENVKFPYRCSLDGPLPDLCFWYISEIQDGCQGQ